ncbi:MAG: M23 family metallopeptidase [Methylacidiphilales bacterium]|nr:M23 family metallopeptidase [Candidatus Methylacidiphilales bacterium]
MFSQNPFKGFSKTAIRFYRGPLLAQIVIGGGIGFVLLFSLRLIYLYFSPPTLIQEEIQIPLSTLENSSIDIDVANRGTGIWYNLKISKNQKLVDILTMAKIKSEIINKINNIPLVRKVTKDLSPGKYIRLLRSIDGAILELEYDLNDTKQLVITQNESNYSAVLKSIPLDYRDTFVSLTIRDSIIAEGNRKNISQAVVRKLLELFVWDLDFSNELQKGDVFNFIYETIYRDGVFYKNNKILIAEYVPVHQKKKTIKVLYFEDDRGKGEYYNDKGKNIKKSFLRQPVDPALSRLSSRFSTNRYHPTLKVWRGHFGVDYAAAIGTPIYAVADGRIEYIGYKGSYGNLIKIKHTGNYTTLYGHMQRFAKGTYVGKYIKQKDIIGYVGNTGLSSGPHVHFELLINDKYVDPSKVEFPSGKDIPATQRREFSRIAYERFLLLKENKENEINNGATQGSIYR